MSDFFSTLFKWNKASGLKALAGLAAGVLSAAAFITFPPVVLGAATIIGMTTATLGIHAAHLAEPPKKPL